MSALVADREADLDRDSIEFFMLLFEIVLDGEKRLASALTAHDLTPPQFYVLKTLTEQGGDCPIGQIARIHHLTNATMTGLVSRLEAFDPPLVVRERNTTDRRSIHVRLTPAGEERYMAVQTDFLQQLRQILSLLNGEERQDLLKYLSRYVHVLADQFPVSPVES